MSDIVSVTMAIFSIFFKSNIFHDYTIPEIHINNLILDNLIRENLMLPG
jgi:hypothetical protein